MPALMQTSSIQRFPIRLDRRFGWFLRLFGVNADNAWVDLGETLDARFGWSRVRTPVANIRHWSIEGPWLALTAMGVRMSIRHRDLTFGGSPHGGVRVDFRERPRYLVFRLPALYLTVDDLDAFAATLAARGIPGEDRRKGPSP